ncbi:hypothetical protein MEO93_26210 [Dolichospermum sp. ST_sed3]|nr:hypothetical protein [Dolichospermum sp. ST_sed3]
MTLLHKTDQKAKFFQNPSIFGALATTFANTAFITRQGAISPILINTNFNNTMGTGNLTNTL